MSERVLRGEAATEAFGACLAQALGPSGALVELEGDLGAGKTTLVRGLLRALGHQGRVRSPTYTLVEPYEIDGRRVFHLDLYRIADAEELEYIGIRELGGGSDLMFVEWPQRGRGHLPTADIALTLEYLDEASRRIRWASVSDHGQALVSRLEKLVESMT